MVVSRSVAWGPRAKRFGPVIRLRRPVLTLALAGATVGCYGSTEPRAPGLTGNWVQTSQTPVYVLWSMSLSAWRDGSVSGTAFADGSDAAGWDTRYKVTGSYDHAVVTLTLETDGFALGPTFNGELVSADTLVGRFSVDDIVFVRTGFPR